MEQTPVKSPMVYSPLEITTMFRDFVGSRKQNNVIFLRGLYLQKAQNPQWGCAYDELRDTDGKHSITLKISTTLREKLKPNSLVQVRGLLEVNQYQNGNLQVLLNVTGSETIKDQFVTEQDIKRNEIRVKKTAKGFKQVDTVLEQKLMLDERPKVVLVFATTSITMADFDAGKNAAASKIDFYESRVSFGNAAQLTATLKSIDTGSYDVIALIRGGGNGIESLDDLTVLDAVANLKTPFICAIGHVKEELFLKTISDKVAPTPNGLGQYFSEMVESVAQKRQNSRAVLVKQIEDQFKKQIEDSNKKNKELIEQIDKLQKQSAAQTKSFNENIEKLQKENKTAIDTLSKQNEANLKKVQEENGKTIASIQNANKQALEQVNKTNEGLQKSLQQVNTRNTEITKELAEMTAKNRELADKLSSNKGSSAMTILAIVSTIIAAFALIYIFIS